MILTPYLRWRLRLLYIIYLSLVVVISDGAVVSLNGDSLTSHNAILPSSLTKRIPHKAFHKSGPTGGAIFHIAGIVTSVVNMIGSSLMIYLTIRKNNRKSKPFTPSKRFPFYMAIMDFGASAVTLPNLFYPMKYGHLMNGNLCTSLGFITSLLILMNMMLMVTLAIVTYLRICKRYVVNLGKMDWILFVSILIPTLTISLVALSSNGFGPDTFWCFMNQEEGGSQVEVIALMVFACIITVVTSFCYIRVIIQIRNVEAMLTSASFTKSKEIQEMIIESGPHPMTPALFKTKTKRSSFPTSDTTSSSEHATSLTSTMDGLDGLEIIPPSFFGGSQPYDNDMVAIIPTASQKHTVTNIAKATRKMSSYIFLQLIQYIPIIIYSLCFLLNQMQTWVYVLTIVMLNLGGVTKSFAFMKNEILYGNSNKKEKKSCKTPLNENFSKSFGNECFTNIELNSPDDDNNNHHKSVPFISVTFQQENDDYFNLENIDDYINVK